VFVGDEEVVRVHVHTAEPQGLLDAVAELGRLSRVKVEDMAAQHERLLASGSGAGVKTALLAMSPGPGFDRIFGGYGAAVALLGDQIKPSAEDIAKAADALRVADVVVLPNHKNVLLAAQQAAGITQCTLHVVPASNLAQGIAAAVAYKSSALPADNSREMNAVLEEPVCVEVTIASADRVADGVRVQQGQAIVLVDGTLVAATDDTLEALLAGLGKTEPGDGLITVFAGANVKQDPETLRERIEAEFEGAEVEILSGGQQLYPFIASVER
jgi:dihydroxyacetone kinase-like predicted kinase